MLSKLQIQNVALVTQLEIEFGDGLNILTGETGAGKSIIIGSFNFILGQRLDKSVIRGGANFARVDAIFLPLGTERNKVEQLSGVEILDNQIILSRTIKATGSGECRINGTIVTAEILRLAAGVLINIHGQHETEVLLKPKNHVAILDSFGGQRVINARNNYLDEVDELKKLEKQLKIFGGDDFERKRLVDMYQYQIKDIEDANLRDGEDDELAEKKNKMMNFEKLTNGLKTAASLFDGDNGIENLTRQAVTALGGISHLDPRIERYYDTAKSLKIEIDDLVGDIQSYFDDFEFDENEFKRVDERLDEIKVLKRKYGSSIAEIFTFLNETRASYELLTRSEEDVEKIKIQIEKKKTQIQSLADQLVAIRRSVAADLESKIVTEIKDLGMPSARFTVADICVDNVTFLFSANAGVAPRPLVHIISGGEMSRFMLALKVVTANMDSVGTLVFDEIDTGISGIMGHKIAEKMTSICKFHQVIAVTHLAQIAATADNHFLISKQEINIKTTTSVSKLSKSQSKNELARMVGGEDFVKNLTK